MIKIFFVLLIASISSISSADTYLYRTDLRGTNVSKKYSFVGKTYSDDGMIKVYVRGCGSITLFRNEKKEIPESDQLIKFNAQNCLIQDWEK